jgi:hypothetical protein
MAVLSKRVYSDNEMNAFNQKLHGLNELIKSLGQDKSPFFMGT